MAVLDVIEVEGLLRNAGRNGEILRKGLKGLAKSFPRMGAVRGAGLFLGADMKHPEAARRTPWRRDA